MRFFYLPKILLRSSISAVRVKVDHQTRKQTGHNCHSMPPVSRQTFFWQVLQAKITPKLFSHSMECMCKVRGGLLWIDGDSKWCYHCHCMYVRPMFEEPIVFWLPLDDFRVRLPELSPSTARLDYYQIHKAGSIILFAAEVLLQWQSLLFQIFKSAKMSFFFHPRPPHQLWTMATPEVLSSIYLRPGNASCSLFHSCTYLVISHSSELQK
jgi:hypothetical protein